MRRSLLTICAVLVFVVLLLFSLGCSWFSTSRSGEAPAGKLSAKVEKVVFAFPTKNFELLALLAGSDKGFFREEGLEVEFKYLANPVIQAGLEKGEIDYGGILGTGLRSALQGRPVKAISAFTTGPTWAILGQPELNSVADLRGKTVSFGSAAGTTAQVGRAMLKAGGLDPEKDVEIIVIQENERALAAMIAKSTAATILQEPAISLAIQRGFKQLAYGLDTIKVPSSGLVVGDKKLAENRDQVKRFARATLRSIKYVKENKEEVSKFIAREFEIDDLAVATGSYDHVAAAITNVDLDPTEGIKAAAQSEMEGLGQQGPVPLDKLADTSVWKEAQRELGYVK